MDKPDEHPVFEDEMLQLSEKDLVAREKLPTIREYLAELEAIGREMLPKDVPEEPFGYMLYSFALLQIDYLAGVLALGDNLAAGLVARAMIEGLVKITWAAQHPSERVNRWGSFALVLDWRAAGSMGDKDYQRRMERELVARGDPHLTREARDARKSGQNLPSNPYSKTWTGMPEAQVFASVKAEPLYDFGYRDFSDLQHWNPGALRFVVKPAARAEFTPVRPSLPASACCMAFQSCYETFVLVNETLALGRGAVLDDLRERFIRDASPPSAG